MTTYTWVKGSHNLAGAINEGDLPSIELEMPGGSTFRRFMLRNVSFQGLTTGNDVRYLHSWGWEIKVTVFLNFGERSKVIYTASYGIPCEITSLYDSQTDERIYTQVLTGGDREFGFDQATAYGRQTDTATGVLLFESFLFASQFSDGSLGTLVGNVNYEFAAVYGTPG